MKFSLPVLLAGAFALALSTAASAADIVDTAIAGKFNTLVAAVKAAGLVETLKGPARSPCSRPQTKLSPSCRPAHWKLCSSRRTKPSCRAFSRITSYPEK